MRSEDKIELWLYLIGTAIVAAIFFVMLPKWSKGEEVQTVLLTAGYSDIRLGSFAVLECGDDLFGMHFEAKGPNGSPAKGAVCKGIFKGATIRLTP